MKVYKLTVFEKDGKKILDESFEAASDLEAKKTGESMLEEKGYLDHIHRCTSPLGKLLLFHV
ncbi:YhzD family protein [Rossellomorea aquimaris]|uniref:YhzD family protein n=1 Tax=Rossellomorea aquimaris TaxID=189382 RepID=UPI0007D0B35C|nr:YhzD family protein [Rossellomorea aquimaris]